MGIYLKGLRLVWWNEGMNGVLSFFFLWPVIIPFMLIASIVQSFYFTYLCIKGGDTHSWYWEMIDRAGVYRCHLHNQVFGREGCRVLGGKG